MLLIGVGDNTNTGKTLAKQPLLVLSPATLATKARVIAGKGDMIE